MFVFDLYGLVIYFKTICFIIDFMKDQLHNSMSTLAKVLFIRHSQRVLMSIEYSVLVTSVKQFEVFL
jgi:hypothetical protein